MHLHYMLTEALDPTCAQHVSFLCEVFKNSCRAVVERHADGFDDPLPPVHCHIVHGYEDVTIRISDEGGGVSRAALPNIWKFMYTTSRSSALFSLRLLSLRAEKRRHGPGGGLSAG